MAALSLSCSDGFKYLNRFLSQDISGWNIVPRQVIDMDNVTVGNIWLAMFASIIVISILSWYLSNVLPWAAVHPKRLSFPLSVSEQFPYHFESTTNKRDLNLSKKVLERLTQKNYVRKFLVAVCARQKKLYFFLRMV